MHRCSNIPDPAVHILCINMYRQSVQCTRGDCKYAIFSSLRSPHEIYRHCLESDAMCVTTAGDFKLKHMGLLVVVTWLWVVVCVVWLHMYWNVKIYLSHFKLNNTVGHIINTGTTLVQRYAWCHSYHAWSSWSSCVVCHVQTSDHVCIPQPDPDLHSRDVWLVMRSAMWDVWCDVWCVMCDAMCDCVMCDAMCDCASACNCTISKTNRCMLKNSVRHCSIRNECRQCSNLKTISGGAWSCSWEIWKK